MSNKIPTINIVSDKEEDDDNNIPFLGEAITDVEDLEETATHLRKRRPKLLIRIDNDFGSNTDVEDMEGSDVDEPPALILHKNRIPNANFNLDIGTVEEVCKITDQTRRSNSKLSSQKILSPRNERSLISSFKEMDVTTDLENMSASDDSESVSDVPDIDINLAMFECADSMKAKDSIKYDLVATPSPCATPCLSEAESITKKNKNSKTIYGNRLYASMFQIANVTDIEMLESDIENGKQQIPKKAKKNKKRRSKNKAKSSSEKEVNSNNVFSKPAPRKSASTDFSHDRYLSIKKTDCNKIDGATDIEEFDTDTNVITEYIYDNSALTKELEKMQHFYGPTKEKHVYKRRKGAISKDPIHFSDDDSDKHDSGDKPDKQRYIRNQNRYLPDARKSKQPQYVSKIDEKCFTDVEDINSSDGEEIITQPLRKIKQKEIACGYLTEEEVLMETNDYLSNLPQIKLPSATREMIFIKENDGNTPTVVVTPLEEDIQLGLNLQSAESTDVEELSGNDPYEDDNNQIVRNISPIFEIDTGTTQEREFLRSSPRSLQIPTNRIDNLTDTEDIVMGIDNPHKSKFLTLTINKNDKSEITDTEDIYLSDAEGSKRKSNLRKGNPNKNKEKMIEFKNKNLPNDSCADDLGVSNYDESHSGASTPRKEYNPKLRKFTTQRSKEKKSAASDEVMYLRGGCYSEIITDIDYPYACEGKAKVVAKLYASDYRSLNFKIPRLFRLRMSTRDGFVTNFNIDCEPVRLQSLSLFYVNYCYTITVPYTEKSTYYFGFPDLGETDKSKRFFSRQMHKKLPNSIARLVTKFESFSAGQDSTVKLQKRDNNEKAIAPTTKKSNVNSGCSFVKRVVNAGKS